MADDMQFSPVEADLLLGPKLRTFGLDFSIYDQHSESWTDFGDMEEDWVRKFAEAAIARNAALKQIHITFNPDAWGSKEEDGYPWDRMDKIRDQVRPHGIALEYSDPTITKEGWLEGLRQRNQESATENNPTVDNASSNSPTSRNTESDSPEQSNPDPVFEGRDIREYFPPTRRL